MDPCYAPKFIQDPCAIRRCAHLVLALILPAAVLAQPVLQASDIASSGASFVYEQANYMSMPNAGANQTWNISAAVPTNDLTFNWVTPGSTDGGSYFPTATVAVSPVALFQLDQYFTITSTQMDDIGTYIPFILTTCSDPITILKFPLAYGTSWTDAYTCSRDDSGLIFSNITGNLSATADGYGTLITPYATINNVIRVSLTNNNTIVGGGTTTVTTITAQYYWKPGAGSYVAYNYIQQQTVNGIATTPVERLRYLNGSAIGMDELVNNAIGIDIAPNPADDRTLITFATQGLSTLEVFNTQGQAVQEIALGHKGPGIHQEHLDTSALRAGVYTVVIRSANGDQGVKRLVVQ